MAQYLEKKRKAFYRISSSRLIRRFQEEEVMPIFKDNKYDKERKRDFEAVVKEFYTIQPKIFLNLGIEQKKSFLGLLNLLLDTDQRDNLMGIIEGVVNLSEEERKSLASVLKKSSLTKIVRTIKLVEQRYEVIELLKTLIFDLHKFTTERGHIQKAIEENYWLFGEQYNLVSADKSFEDALKKYLSQAGMGSGEDSIEIMGKGDKKRRPDIFMCSKMHTPDYNNSGSEIEENIIVELKTPDVKVGKEQLRQIEDYMEIIMKTPQFNSSVRKWKFYVVSATIEQFVLDQYKAFEDKGKRHLVKQVEKYEIYAMSWDDVFTSFDIRHRYLLDKLDFDKKAIQEALQTKNIELSRPSSDVVTAKVLEKTSTV